MIQSILLSSKHSQLLEQNMQLRTTINEKTYFETQKNADIESGLKREIAMLKSELFFKNEQVNDRRNETGARKETKITREAGVGTNSDAYKGDTGVKIFPELLFDRKVLIQVTLCLLFLNKLSINL